MFFRSYYCYSIYYFLRMYELRSLRPRPYMLNQKISRRKGSTVSQPVVVGVHRVRSDAFLERSEGRLARPSTHVIQQQTVKNKVYFSNRIKCELSVSILRFGSGVCRRRASSAAKHPVARLRAA